jgi:hypothetical protein
MNPAREPEFNPTSKTERIQFLLSRQLDGDLTQAETAELTAAQGADAYLAGLTGFSNLRSLLRALPVKPVAGSFSTTIRNAIHSESSTMPASSVSHGQRGWMTRGIVAVSVTACLATLMLIMRTQDSGPAAGQTVQMSGNVAVKAGSASADVAGPAAESEAVPETASQQEDLRPFLENDNWRIVVVKVHSKDREEVLRDIEALVAKNGMDIRPVAGHDDHDARFGVLLTSSGVDDKVLVESILPQTDSQSADWNAQSVAASTRESLITRLQESMKIPTHSEMHFGQVYVTLRKPAATSVVDAPLLARNSVAEETAVPLVAGKDVTESKARVAGVRAAPRLPVLVVFEFTDETTSHI